jgi:transcriptional regulator with XRE-family HTH domain
MPRYKDGPLARFVSGLLAEKGWNQEDLAGKLDVGDPSIVSHWVTGRALPKDETIIKLAALAQIDAGDLLRLKQAVTLARRGIVLPTQNGDLLSPFERDHLRLIREGKLQEAINQLVDILVKRHAAIH